MDQVQYAQLAKNNPYMKMFVHLMRVGNIIDRKAEKLLKDYGITLVQFNILRILEASYPKVLSVGNIKEQLFFPASDVTRLLDRMEKVNVIKRKICPKNRRKVDVSITSEGLNLINDCIPAFNNRFNGYFSTIISEKERDTLIDVLKRIKEE